MEVIHIHEAAYYALLDEMVKRIGMQLNKKQDKWISGEEAMKMLRITSKTTLQKLRDDDKIRFTQPEKKIILYDSDSILEYLNNNSNKPI